MLPKKGMRLTRAQKIIDKIMHQNNSTDLSFEDEVQNENNDTECTVSPLPSGAEYAVEDLSFEIFVHTDLQLTKTVEDDARTSPIDKTESVIFNTPMPSPPMSFSAYSNVDSSFKKFPFTNSDYLTSTPQLIEPMDDNYENPSSVISSDIQCSASVSEPAVYS
ncbi:hypothetical protein evm_011758 [Chilo suppressalis]|nr:hypothetical protein evm_011758 [Chilo suppressalis]